MAIKYLKSAKLRGKTVLVRVDFNTPVDKKTGKLSDDFRIRAVLPTIEYLQKQNCRIILCSHFGRPKGEHNAKYSLRPIAKQLADLLKAKYVETNRDLPQYRTKHVIFYTGDLQSEGLRPRLAKQAAHDVVLLENLRFYKGEEANDAFFARRLSDLAEIYVNEAFAVSHRAAASIVAITKYLPSYAGLLLEKEIKNLRILLDKPSHPFVVMMGGIKISDKAKTLQNLGKRADKILLGGGLANLFYFAKGMEIGISKVERESKTIAWQMDKNFGDKLLLPKDVVVANKDMEKSSIRACDAHEVRKSEIILDLGPKSILEFASILKSAKTIVWNGPLGLFEVKPFHTATMSLSRVIGGVSGKKCFTVVGGGETVDAVHQSHQQDYIDHVSTGGGAMLEFLAGNKLPGLEALDD